ncbi:hypothetical protein PMAYCL1PPCAC_00058, partial [Pristionchus mayeri]
LKEKPDIQQWRQATQILSRLLSKRENDLSEQMIDCGLVPFLVQGLSINDEEIQHPCVKAIMNIVENWDEESSKVIESGAAAPLIRLMTHSNLDLAEEATKAVAEVARESEQLRDFVHALKTLCEKLKELPISFVRLISRTFWNISNHWDSQVDLKVLGVMVQGLFRLLQCEDREVCEHAIASLTHITCESDRECKLVLDSGILPLVFKCLKDDDDDLLYNVTTVLINIWRRIPQTVGDRSGNTESSARNDEEEGGEPFPHAELLPADQERDGR